MTLDEFLANSYHGSQCVEITYTTYILICTVFIYIYYIFIYSFPGKIKLMMAKDLRCSYKRVDQRCRHASFKRMAGRISGRTTTWLHRPLYCVLTSSLYFGFCWLLWRPIPLELSPGARLFWLVPGAFLLFTGWGLVLWARLTLGKFYFVSTAFGAQISDQHQWVTHGPFALIRHPMYLVILLIGLGEILISRTWTMVFIALHFVLLVRRTIREEEALAAEFGEQWQDYCKQTPRSIPRFSWRGGIITTSSQYSGFGLHPWVE